MSPLSGGLPFPARLVSLPVSQILRIQNQSLDRRPCRLAILPGGLALLLLPGSRWEVIKLLFLLLRIYVRHLVLLGKNLVDLDKRPALGLWDDHEDVDGGEETYNRKDDEAVRTKAHLWGEGRARWGVLQGSGLVAWGRG